MTEIGKKIKFYREAAGISQQDLADKINLLIGTSFKRSAISNYENGVSSPSAKVLKAISGSLNTSTDSLLDADLATFTSLGGMEELARNIDKAVIKALRKGDASAFPVYMVILATIDRRVRKNGELKQKEVQEAIKREFRRNEIIDMLVKLEFLSEKDVYPIANRYLKSVFAKTQFNTSLKS